MRGRSAAIWVLYKGFFDAVPGQRGLLAIGLSSMALGHVRQGSGDAALFILAGIAFMAGFTLLFAGPHFRQLAGFRRHRLLPQFRSRLVIGYLGALVTLSLFVLAGLALLGPQASPAWARWLAAPAGWIALAVLGLVLIVSFIGFLPGPLRYVVGALTVVGAANAAWLGTVPVERLLQGIVGLSTLGTAAFVYWVGIVETPVFYRRQSVSLSKYLPGWNASFEERGVTAVGSLLLGMPDGTASRTVRAASGALLLPLAMAGAVAMTSRYSAAQIFGNPLFMLVGLMTAVMLQAHFAFTVAARRRFIWLRVGGSRPSIDQAARQVLARERRLSGLCFGVWAIPVIAWLPGTAVWLLGVGALLWTLMLVLEQALLTSTAPLGRRAEFYALLLMVGLIVAVIAVAKVGGAPEALWWGVAAMLGLYSALRLGARARAGAA